MNDLIVVEKLAEWQRLKALVLDSVSSPITRRVYNMALDEFIAWYRQQPRPGFTKATVNGLLAPELAAGIARVKSTKSVGIRVGNWLSLRQAQTLLSTPDVARVKGLRDRAILAVLLGCGLRRSEVAALTLTHVQQRDGRWCIVDLVGKHSRVRTVPMPTWVKVAIDAWTTTAGVTEGSVFRPVNRGDRVYGGALKEKVVWQLLQGYAEEAGVPGIAPHDLRRTCAKLCRAAGGELEQIQLLLGHASVQTTEQYLGTNVVEH